MMTPVLSESIFGRPAAISLAVALHALLLIALFQLRTSSIQVTTQREIELNLQSVAEPHRVQPPRHSSRPHPARLLPLSVTLEGLQGGIRELSRLPPVPFSMPDITSVLNCDPGSGRPQKPCLHPGWHYDAQDMRNVLLNEPPPEHEWTAAEVNLYIARTTDPCLADRSAGLPFCVDRIIYGPATIPDSKTPPAGLSLGASLLGGH